jgi:hypothetical protein
LSRLNNIGARVAKQNFLRHISTLFLLFFLAGCSNPQLVPPSTAFPATPVITSTPTSVPTITPTPGPTRPLLMAHYMPWYQTPSISGNGKWGYHWTMNHFDPNQKDANGRQEIASHFYPLTGPYDSQYDALLEY